MKEMSVMASIISEKEKEIAAQGSPELNAENEDIMEEKRMSLDEPMTEVKADPLR